MGEARQGEALSVDNTPDSEPQIDHTLGEAGLGFVEIFSGSRSHASGRLSQPLQLTG